MGITIIPIISRINMPQAYINYYQESLKELEALPKDHKPSLLLHACCGPLQLFSFDVSLPPF
jgi:hypothetical protein